MSRKSGGYGSYSPLQLVYFIVVIIVTVFIIPVGALILSPLLTTLIPSLSSSTTAFLTRGNSAYQKCGYSYVHSTTSSRYGCRIGVSGTTFRSIQHSDASHVSLRIRIHNRRPILHTSSNTQLSANKQNDNNDGSKRLQETLETVTQLNHYSERIYSNNPNPDFRCGYVSLIGTILEILGFEFFVYLFCLSCSNNLYANMYSCHYALKPV